MALKNWLNPKRLRDYPRLIFIASWVVLIINVLFHQGWVGGITGIMIGGDFISNYSGGDLYMSDLAHLYDPAVQEANQTKLISPSKSPGFAPFISPPYVALAFSTLQSIPLPYAFALWEIINIVCILSSAYLLSKFFITNTLIDNQVSAFQLSIIILSSLAIVIGFLAGQSHGIILLLITGITLAMFKEKWWLAGVLGSILIYKPQFILGFLICWLIWRCYKALLTFTILAILWQIPVVAANGITPYLQYLDFSNLLLYLPYAKDNFPISIMATPYAFFATIFPFSFSKIIQIAIFIFGIIAIVLLGFIAYRARSLPIMNRFFTVSMAIILPLVIAPHTLIYDMIILVPALILLACMNELTLQIKHLAIILYICMLFLPLIGYVLKVALPGFIPLALYSYLIYVYFRSNRTAISS
jgi:hypothetical protein